MNYSIRPVKPEDIESLTSVEAICFPEAEAATKESFIRCRNRGKDHWIHQWNGN